MLLSTGGFALGGPGHQAGYFRMPFFSLSNGQRFCVHYFKRFGKTDTSGVWSQSDALSTVYRGKLAYVADAVRGLFVNAFRPGVHMALEGQFSKGCPGDCDGDSLLTREGPVPNLPLVGEKHFPVQAKIALYPMGIPDYIDKIAGVWRMAEKARLNPVSIHYATRISGDVHEVFDYLEAVCRKMEAEVPHYILCFTLSVNSPTQE